MATAAQENLYNLIPVEEQRLQKNKKYVSQFRPTVVEEYNNNRYEHRTMGEATATVHSTDNFLKKHSRDHCRKGKGANGVNNCCGEEGRRNAAAANSSGEEQECGGCDSGCRKGGEFHYPCDQRRPPVPRVGEKPLMGVTTNKNFLKQNAVENIMSVAKKPERAYVDRRIGDRFLLQPSGLDPVYVKKRDFGKVPDYLDSRKKELDKAREDYESYLREVQKRGEMYKMTEEERQETIAGLKSNWEDLHRVYQSLGVMVDTIPKQNRKQRLETEMKILEKDIETLERHRHIYVAN